jgi:hypothetical protein
MRRRNISPLFASLGLSALCIVGSTTLTAADGDPKRTRREVYEDLLTRHQTAQSQLITTENDLARIEAWLEHHQISVADLAAKARERESEVTEQEQRTEALAEIVQRLKTLMEIDIDALEAALAEALARRDLLKTELEKLVDTMPVAPPRRDIQEAVSLEGMTARTFLLTDDRIAPFARPYFEATPIKVRLANRGVVQRTRFERQSDAGAAADAVQPGGVLHALVTAEEFDPGTTYVTLWVCADAIPSYRQVVAFLKQRGVRYTWVPDVDSPWTALDEESSLGDWGY